IGFGTYRLKKNAVTEPLEKALTAGYTMLDTASVYDNEKEIGQLLSQRPEAPFVVTKLWRSHQGDPDTVRKYVKTSLRKLKLGRPLDMLIMHWPGPGQHRVPQNWTPATRLQTWRTLCGLINEPNATIRSIGVSNFSTRHLQEIIDNGEEIPAINQIEMHPFLIQKEMRTFCQLHSIIVMAYGSLGGTNRELLTHHHYMSSVPAHLTRILLPTSCAQILLRWAVQHDAIIIPCSSSEAHIQDNLDIFGFELSTQQMDRLDALDCGRRWGW
ncbi:aldo/keto reductase, partial [Gaertneriomyces semiglobifer]